MAVTLTLSNHYKYQLMDKQIDLSADDSKILLINNHYEDGSDNQLITYLLKH